MTCNAFRNNVQPMFLGIALIVMVLLCLFSAVASQSCNMRQASVFYGMIDSFPCLISIWMFFLVSMDDYFEFVCFLVYPVLLYSMRHLAIAIASSSSFSTILITSVRHDSLLTLVVRSFIFAAAVFALSSITIFGRMSFVEIRKWLNCLALRALFCYGWFRHNQFLTNWLCFEPLESQPLYGSFYYTTFPGGVK